SVTSMSPFGSQAMLHGLRKPSATVTTLKASPAGPGGCANVEVETVSVAAAMSPAAARMDAANLDVAFMGVPLVSAPALCQKKQRCRAAIVLVCPNGRRVYLSATPRPEATQACREVLIRPRLTLRAHWARLVSGVSYERSQSIHAGGGRCGARIRRLRCLCTSGAEARDGGRPARLGHRRPRALRVPGSLAARAGHQRAARRTADSRARAGTYRGHGRARHRHPGTQRQHLLVVLGESRRCERGGRDARRRFGGLVQGALDAFRGLELRRAAVPGSRGRAARARGEDFGR